MLTYRARLQVSAPLYKLVVTSLGGEKRFAAAMARRPQSLNTFTTRQTGWLTSHACLQVSAPLYKLVVTSLGGEKRFAAAVARRLQSLGALTRGDRRAAAGVDLSESNLDNPLGRKALK